jgi:SAM-dependent methyltransferase
MHKNSLELFKYWGLPCVKNGDKVLEVGPDWAISGGMCRPLILANQAEYTATDPVERYANDEAFIKMPDFYTIPTPKNHFDVVFSLSVIEHVPKIWTWVKELVRATKPNGLVVLVNPVSWPYHESPVDCWRILPEGYKALFEECGLTHEFSWTGNLTPLEDYLVAEHGPHQVTDTIAIGRKTA